MIIEPSVVKLMENENMDSRYTLVVAAAKRAREIAQEDPKIDKAVKRAVLDIADGKVRVIPAPEHEETPIEDIVYKDYVEKSEDDDDEYSIR